MVNHHILALLGPMILVPGTAFAQTADGFAEPTTPPVIEHEDDTVGSVGIVDELMAATMLGIHITAGCTITLDTELCLDHHYDEKGVKVCDDLDNPKFHIFTSWESIVSELEIEQ
ncbi:MAG: hypothetical protein EB830_05325 [Nitrosopumilus sp. H13]|nr:MAG: hypothetical protein EB830_05325 [Nitrosopumilus sp. H13]